METYPMRKIYPLKSSLLLVHLLAVSFPVSFLFVPAIGTGYCSFIVDGPC